jgi:hypothetical protein
MMAEMGFLGFVILLLLVFRAPSQTASGTMKRDDVNLRARLLPSAKRLRLNDSVTFKHVNHNGDQINHNHTHLKPGTSASSCSNPSRLMETS